MADQTLAQIQAHENYLRQLEALKSQVNSIEPTPFQRINQRAGQQFRDDRNKKLIEIEQAAKRSETDLTHLRQQAIKSAPASQKPMTEAQQLAAQARDDKRKDAIESEEPQKKLAESKLEQQKAADTASAVTLGAGGQTLTQLLKNSTIKRDPDTGNYVFSQPNEGGKLTPEQARNAKTFAGLMKAKGITDDPATLFASGVAPRFDSKGMSVPVDGGNPFIGTQSDYVQLAKAYQAAQPTASNDITVPATALNKAFTAAAPAFGDALPRNPVDIDAATPAAARFVADRAATGNLPALETDARLARPVSLFGGQGGQMTLGVPATPPLFGPQPATPEERRAQGAANMNVLSQLTPKAPDILAEAQKQGLSADDPAVLTAIRQQSAQEGLERLPSRAADIIGGAYDVTPVGLLDRAGAHVAKTLLEAPSVIGDALDTAKQDALEQKALQDKARALRGLEPLPPVSEDELNLPQFSGS